MTMDGKALILEEFLPYRLSVLSNRVSKAIAARYEKFGISLPQWRIMAVLGGRTDLSASEVSERTAMDKVAVSRAVNQLLKMGLIERHFAENDRRRSVLALSADGTRIYEQVVPIALAYEKELLTLLDGAAIAQLDSIFVSLDRALDEMESVVSPEPL